MRDYPHGGVENFTDLNRFPKAYSWLVGDTLTPVTPAAFQNPKPIFALDVRPARARNTT